MGNCAHILVLVCYHYDLRDMSLYFPTGRCHLSQVRGGKSYSTLWRHDEKDMNSAAVTEVLRGDDGGLRALCTNPTKI